MPASELHDLLSRKLAQCGVMFDFLDCVADLKGKEVKRAALNELVECVGSTRGVLIEPVYPDIIRMVSAPLSRPDWAPSLQGTPLDPRWEPHVENIPCMSWLGLRALSEVPDIGSGPPSLVPLPCLP